MKSNPIHKHLAVIAITTVLGLAAAGAADVREEFHKTYPLDKAGKVHLDNVNGNVRVITWDREEVKVDAMKRAKKQEHLDAVRIEVDAKDDSLRIKTKYPDSKTQKNNSTSVDYTLTVPKEIGLERINTVNGGVEIQNVRGDVEANSVNGPVTATGLAGEVQLSTVNGSVKATLASLTKEVSLKSVNGSVTLAVPPDANADVSANTLNGGITSDFSLTIKKGSFVGRSINGKLGEGGPTVKMSSVNGGIRIDRAKAVALEEP